MVSFYTKLTNFTIIDYITIKDIVFCASDISSTHFFLLDGRKIIATKPLKNYEELLEENMFFRASKFHLININHVLLYQKEKSIVKMIGNHEIEVARRKRKEFIEFMDKKLMN